MKVNDEDCYQLKEERMKNQSREDFLNFVKIGSKKISNKFAPIFINKNGSRMFG